MFVSILLDPGSVDSARSLVNILSHSGFKKTQRACWENMNMNEALLSELKRDIDRVTDYYDNVRIYQFPIDGMFVITELKEKKWRRCQLKGQSPQEKTVPRTSSSSSGLSSRAGSVQRKAAASRNSGNRTTKK